MGFWVWLEPRYLIFSECAKATVFQGFLETKRESKIIQFLGAQQITTFQVKIGNIKSHSHNIPYAA
jgi:hypothetical protein